MIDYVSLLGCPYTKGGRSAAGYDCYGVTIDVHKAAGIKIPDIASPDGNEAIARLMNEKKSEWHEHWSTNKGTPFEPALVKPLQVLLIAIKGTPFHVGTCVRPGKFIHAWEKSGGVLVERIDFWKHRVRGVYSYNG